MGLIINVGGNDRLFDTGLVVLPSTLNEGLDFLHFLTDGVDNARINLSGGDAASVVGAPTVNDGFLGLTGGSKFLATAVADKVAQTILFIGRLNSDGVSIENRINFAGSYGPGASGTSVVMGNINMSAAAYYEDSPGTFSIKTANAPHGGVTNDWVCGVASWDDASVDVYNMTAGNSGSVAGGANGRELVARNVAIGGYSTLTGDADVMLAIGWSRRLTADERTAAYSYGQRLADLFGVTV